MAAARPLLLAAALLAAAGGIARAAPPGSPWDARHFGNAELVTQDGRRVRLYDDLIRDKRVVFSFIFTRCTKQCGLIAASLARVQRELGDRLGQDVFFYSISLDPEHDTPEVLKRYAAAFHAGPGWTFLTGRKEDIQAIRRRFGDRAAVEDHTANLDIGNDVTGTWRKTGALDRPEYLAAVIRDWMDPGRDGRGATAAPPGPSTAEEVSPPARLFQAKCLACHLPDGQSVGPPLRGVVARRGEAWLTRWLTAPERLLAERDPVALELLARHGGVPMPNLGLGAGEVAALIRFMDEPARRPAAAR